MFKLHKGILLEYRRATEFDYNISIVLRNVFKEYDKRKYIKTNFGTLKYTNDNVIQNKLKHFNIIYEIKNN